MGSSDLKLLLIAGLIMKLFVVSAVLLAGVALAEPGHNHHHRGHKGHGYRRGYYYGKREAEPEATAVAEANAEADADAYYGGYYGYGLGYGLGYGYGGYGLGYGYGGYGGYGLGFYGKREAEPGHHHGHGKRRGYYGYRTRGYYYGKREAQPGHGYRHGHKGHRHYGYGHR